ncbi:MAG: glucose ABC transporter permease GlcU [Thermocladium sp.]|jgi:glucose/arabinose transport system permease protein
MSKTKTKRISPAVKAAIHQLVIIIFVVIWLVPIYAMVINGLKSNLAVSTTPVLVPSSSLTLEPFQAVLSSLGRPLLNSLIIVLPVAFIATFLGSMAAYFFYMLSNSFSKVSSFISNFLFSLIALATFIPYQATLIPLTKLIADMGLLNTYWGLAFAFFIFYMPTGALLMSVFITAIPPRIIEAARLDKGSDWRIFIKIVFPLSLPGFVSTLVFNIIEIWNNFFIPLMLTTTPDMRLIPVTVQSFTGGYATLYNETFAAAFIASIVPLGIFIFLGRYFIKGLTALGAGGKGV